MSKRRKSELVLGIRSCAPSEHKKWQFDNMPPSQAQHCYLYEYCLEIPEIIKEVEDYRSISAKRKYLEERAKVWRIMNALRGKAETESAAEQFLRFTKENQELMKARYTRLDNQVAFLLDCHDFPAKHWMQRSESQRRQNSKYQIIDLDLWLRLEGARTKLSLVPREELLELLKARQPQRSGDQWNLTNIEGWEETFAVRVNWHRSTTELMKDFARLLEKQLRGSRVPFQKTKYVPSRTTPPAAALKKLAAARLLRAYEAALKKGNELNDAHGQPIELFAEPSDWRRAARKAEEIRVRLANQLLKPRHPETPPSTIVVTTEKIGAWVPENPLAEYLVTAPANNLPKGWS